MGSLSWTSRTFYFPDSRDLLEVLGGLPWQRERPLGRIPWRFAVKPWFVAGRWRANRLARKWLAMSRPQAHEPRQRPRSSWHRAIVSMVPSFGISVVGHRTPLARFEDPGHASMQSKQPHSRLRDSRSRGPAAWYLLVQTVGSSRPLRASWDVDS